MKTYEKLLVAKNSPKNHCYADDGDILVFASGCDARPDWLKEDDHFFISLQDRILSLYGWVSRVDEPISAESFAKMDIKQACNNSDLDVYVKFLEAINKYPEGTPIQAWWQEVGIFEKKKIIKFTKVFFR